MRYTIITRQFLKAGGAAADTPHGGIRPAAESGLQR